MPFKKGHKGYPKAEDAVLFKGKKYKTTAALCRFLKINLSSFRTFQHYKYKNIAGDKRKIKKINIEADIIAYKEKHAKYRAPDGIFYSSFAECCRQTGVSYGAAYNRIMRKNCPTSMIFSKKRLKKSDKKSDSQDKV